MSKLETTRINLPGTMADNRLPVAPRNAAIALIDEGNALEEQGRTAEAMARYDAAVQVDPACARAHLNRGNVLLAAGRIDEARGAYELAITCDPHYAAAHFNLGNLNCHAGEHERALPNYQAAIDVKPDFTDAFVAMANALDHLGRASEAIASYERALAINPSYAEVHFNLGVLAMSEGRHLHAADSLRRAIDLRPDYVAAHYALGRVLTRLGRFDAAEASLRRALSVAPESPQILKYLAMSLVTRSKSPDAAQLLMPDYAAAHHAMGSELIRLGHFEAAEASLRRALSITPESGEVLYDLAFVLLARSKSPEAVQLIMRHLERAPTWPIKMAFAVCAARTKFLMRDAGVRAALTVAITEPWCAPYELCRPALSLIMLEPEIASCVRLVNERWPVRVPTAELFNAEVLAALAADPLLHAMLEAAPVGTIEFERFLTAARHALLETATSEQPPDPADLAALPFYASLARQCFINEYIFDCDGSEQAAAVACRTRLLTLLDANAAVSPLLLLAVAAYFPLYTLPEPGRLLGANQPGPIDGVLRQQVREPLEEQELRADVKCLTSVADGVSENVREMYEQNPYPRWVKLPIHGTGLGFNDELQRNFPLARLIPLRDDSQPEMLIAGCGTGSQPILTSQRLRGLRVLAIDLSLNSISYAVRKARELGITNIEYAQADILKLGDLARTFDIIASVGVLHHLADPFLGWRTLLSRLRPGGFMQLGFYSELARRHVVKARQLIAARGYASTPDGIRRLRRDLTAEETGPELHWLCRVQDFYSTSECRDLLFHVQEHRLTLEQIESFLSGSGLDFIGFEVHPTVRHQYHTRFTDDPAGTNLRNWARFEADNPDTFAGMYVFWIQKPINNR